VPHALRLIGLTGGIASGKSTVAGLLAALGADVIGADAVYHDLLVPAGGRPSPMAHAIGLAFPSALAGVHIDRARLGETVFADAAARARLEAITHPAIAQETARRVAALPGPLCIYDVPLLYERGLERGMHAVIVVWVDPDTQLRRLQRRDGLSLAQARARLAAQMPLAEKRARADYVVDNRGPREQTAAAVAELWRVFTGSPGAGGE
jgi:dephospho-CoA kinase